MCSIITVKTSPAELSRTFGRFDDPDGLDTQGVEIRVHGFLKKELAPVLFVDAQKRIALRMKYFSMCPDWAKSWPFEFETYNARLTRPKRFKNQNSGKWEPLCDSRGQTLSEDITTVPTFRRAFATGQTCLVPLSGAVESCYFGESAGKVVRFSNKSSQLIFAAGLWNDWFNPLTGEFIPTFTLLTDEPDSTVFAHGHDRSIIPIGHSDWMSWLQDAMDASSRVHFLRSHRIQPEWTVAVERDLKLGWQKRAPSPDEIAQIKVWHPV